MAPITECVKKGVFECTRFAQRAFEEIKQKLCKASVLTLPNFDNLFEVAYDVSRVGIEDVLVQSKRSIAYFSEKLNGVRCNYSTYDKEFNELVRAFTH